MIKFIKNLFTNGKRSRTTTIHERTIKEIEETTKKIEQMNKILVRKSTAYKIYIATGGK